jgi:hypothetical protein
MRLAAMVSGDYNETVRVEQLSMDNGYAQQSRVTLSA